MITDLMDFSFSLVKLDIVTTKLSDLESSKIDMVTGNEKIQINEVDIRCIVDAESPKATIPDTNINKTLMYAVDCNELFARKLVEETSRRINNALGNRDSLSSIFVEKVHVLSSVVSDRKSKYRMSVNAIVT